MPSTAARVPILKFASIRGTLRTSFGIDKDISNSIVPLLDPKFSTVLAHGMRELPVRADMCDQRGERAAARRRDRCRAARPPPISTSTQNESPPARLIGSMRASRLPPSMAMRQTSA